MKFKRTLQAILLSSSLALGKLSVAQDLIIHKEFYAPPKNAEITEYIFKQKEFISDSANQTIYFVFQGHQSPFKEFTLEEEISKIDAIENQLSIYHILDYLSKEKNINMVCSEGIYFYDSLDIEMPYFFNKLASENKSLNELINSIKEGNDIEVINLLLSTGLTSGNLFPLLYESVFLTGFEDEKNDRYFELVDYLTNHPEENTKAIEKKLFNLQREYITLRSSDAITYCTANAEKLHNKKLISNKDFAIVIGAAHSGDYKEIIEEIKGGKRNLNLVLIYPEGIQKYEGFVNYFERY